MTIKTEEETTNGGVEAVEAVEAVESVEQLEHSENGVISSPFSDPESAMEVDEPPKVKHWKESDFAVGLVNITWKDDRPSWWFNTPVNPDGIDRKFTFSSIVCGCLGAKRVGNMAVLAQTTETLEEEIFNTTTGQMETRQRERPKLLWVVGPYWTVNLFITFPLIFGVSGWILFTKIVDSNLPVIITWSIGTFLMVISLCMISCRNPGIMYRRPQMPQDAEVEWRWNDQARTYRPASARFDSECQVVVEGFDHT